MVNEIILMVADALLGFFTLMLLVRFYLQWMRMSARNAFGVFVMKLTDWLVLPLRRVLPAGRGLDWASLLPAIGVQALQVALVLCMHGVGLSVVFGPLIFSVLGLGLLQVIKLSLYLLLGAVIVSAVLSWTHPYSPLKPWLDVVVRPFLSPLQRRIPPIGGVDVSPLVLLLVLQIVLRLIDHAGAALLGRL